MGDLLASVGPMPHGPATGDGQPVAAVGSNPATATNRPSDPREIVAAVPVSKLIEWASDFEAAAHEVPRGLKATILMTRAQEVRAILAALDGGR